jgi:hypothetical protein|tara:strand:- start:9 stop:329 length:321 start_codon:yes stop_codon:yes gene_type:complete
MIDINSALDNASKTALKFAQLDGEARMLEKFEKILLSELVNQANESSIAKAEHFARRHNTYKDHVTKMVLARTDANVAKAEWEAIQMKFESWRTLESTKRAEMNLR